MNDEIAVSGFRYLNRNLNQDVEKSRISGIRLDCQRVPDYLCPIPTWME
ncbi:MAG: hypothetical protein BWZ07_00870 [Alphaproteobacteria bacterium ADurb.BinA280]|jgi:hypothetical protein|nr:hypothetical protein [Xanthomonadales bacterium]OPZ13034.1 MAG: hypothetical protein BWZ07_00870 [Alphaproteobacteria bacterium ADurb.BinA280]